MQAERTNGRIQDARIATDIARRMTTDLYQYVAPGDMDVATVLDMYEWIRTGGVRMDGPVDLPSLARMWTEYERSERHTDWLMRAFGE
jgi:hypothetical protein